MKGKYGVLLKMEHLEMFVWNGKMRIWNWIRKRKNWHHNDNFPTKEETADRMYKILLVNWITKATIESSYSFESWNQKERNWNWRLNKCFAKQRIVQYKIGNVFSSIVINRLWWNPVKWPNIKWMMPTMTWIRPLQNAILVESAHFDFRPWYKWWLYVNLLWFSVFAVYECHVANLCVDIKCASCGVATQTQRIPNRDLQASNDEREKRQKKREISWTKTSLNLVMQPQEKTKCHANLIKFCMK